MWPLRASPLMPGGGLAPMPADFMAAGGVVGEKRRLAVTGIARIDPKVFGLKLACAGVAGVIGATSVFPLDMVKTRLQNQKVGPNGERMYTGIVQCAKTIIRTEGVAGLYMGLVPNLAGIIPEKALKLGVNDILREIFADEYGDVTMAKGLAIGATAGLIQCIATNPMEIVKIRLQTAALNGEVVTMGETVKEMGLKGLYRGAASTLFRDIPFSAMFFCSYGVLKDEWATDANGKVEFSKVLIAGMASGMGAGWLSTPMDVVKTRIQVKNARFNSVREAVPTILQEEGMSAFFKGSVPRMTIIGPLFAIALFSYEVQKMLGKQLGWIKPEQYLD